MAPELLADDNHIGADKNYKLQKLMSRKFDEQVVADVHVLLEVQNYELKIPKENYIHPTQLHQKDEFHKLHHAVSLPFLFLQ